MPVRKSEAIVSFILISFTAFSPMIGWLRSTQEIRRALRLFGCIITFALLMATGCNNKSEPSPTPTTQAQTPPKMKMTTDIPEEITTPDTVETRIGTLKFFDGFPDDKTTQLVYDNLDFQRGVQAFLRGIPGASVQAFLPAAKKFGGVDGQRDDLRRSDGLEGALAYAEQFECLLLHLD